MRRTLATSIVLALVSSTVCCAETAPREAADERNAMVATIRAHGASGPQQIGERVLAAMARVARHEFVPAALRDQAYGDHPLPIGHGQTISQPYIVALMTELAAVEPGDVVLEIGTGSGYQAAVLAELVRRVYTIEIVEPLGREATSRLERLGYDNVEVRIGDGYAGWPEHAPYDAIVVTAAPDEVPPALMEQLELGGRLIIPVGSTAFSQHLTVIEKTSTGEIRRRRVLPVRFVPFTGEAQSR